MNQTIEELKKEVHKEFNDRFHFLKYFIMKDNDFGDKDWNDIKSFIDSLIDRTVQHERDRIVGVIENYKKIIKKE